MNDDIRDRTIEIAEGTASYYSDRLVNCRIIMKDEAADTRFFSCILVDCMFDPPIIIDSPEGRPMVNPVWDIRLFDSVVNSGGGQFK